jgi:hypothetical protein
MDDWYAAVMGLGPKRIPHWEHWSCPDAETYLTGIDYYDHPKLCRERLAETYPQLRLRVPEDDTPIPRPKLSPGDSSALDDEGHARVRWAESTGTASPRERATRASSCAMTSERFGRWSFGWSRRSR